MRRVKDERGFTLIEILMASIILVIGVTVVSLIISNIMNRNFYSHRQTQAVMLAQNKIEELLNEGYSSPMLDDGDYENALNPVNVTGDSAGVFFQYWSIEDGVLIPRSKKITSTVVWENTEGETETVVLKAVSIDMSN